MARKKRIERAGFYHIVNRGVARRRIYMNDDDHMRFLEILADSVEVYGAEIYAYALMPNHYHLLIKTSQANLSLLMRQINSRYSIYFNQKYKRVGPLWQGRFKSWYVYDEQYLYSLVKYIEYNPVKANMVERIGGYRWTMLGGRNDALTLLHPMVFASVNFELVDGIGENNILRDDDIQKVDEIYAAKLEVSGNLVKPKERKPLKSFFVGAKSRELAIANAIGGGWTQTRIAEHLGLSTVAISKIYKNYRKKTSLFDTLKRKGVFWSYSKRITYKDVGEGLFVEHLLKYGNFDDIVTAIALFGKRAVKRIWEERLKSDQRFIKLNLMLARVFFGMNVESDYFKRAKNERLEKLKLLAS